MKLLYCLNCGDIFSPGTEMPKVCKCGYAIALWRDPSRGTLEVASRGGASMLRVLGLNNAWLRKMTDIPDNDDARHRKATQDTCDLAVGYLFQTQSRNCPIIMFMPDERQVFYCNELCYMVPRGKLPGMTREDAKAEDLSLKARLGIQ